MAYGTIKADKITYDDGGSDTDVNVSDIVAKANLASPTFTGTPTAPTATANTNTTQLATTAYVDQSAFAPLASPTLTGTPAAPTAAADTNTTQIATTAYVQTELGDYQTTALGAPLASPTLTGTPVAPTAGASVNTTQLATTEYVTTAVAAVDVSGKADLTGAEFTGDIRIADNEPLWLGSGSNVTISRTTGGTPDYSEIQNRTEDFYIQGAASKKIAFTKWNNGTHAYGAELLAEFIPDEGVKLYYDQGTYADAKFETTSTGITVTGSITTNSGGATFNGDMRIADDDYFYLGAGYNCLMGRTTAGTTDYSEIQNRTEDFFIQAASGKKIAFTKTQNLVYADAAEKLAEFIPDGAVNLYYDNVKKFETTADGVEVTGAIAVDGQYKQAFDALTPATTPAIDCSLGNYFTLDASSTYPSVGWSFTNVPASTVYSCVIKVTTGGSTTINWNNVDVNSGTPGNLIKWSGGAVPGFTAGEPLYIILTTDDTGATWQGTSLIDFAVV